MLQRMRDTAYMEGRAAQRRGSAKEANPYRRDWRTASSDMQRDCWDRGWETAARDNKSQLKGNR